MAAGAAARARGALSLRACGVRNGERFGEGRTADRLAQIVVLVLSWIRTVQNRLKPSMLFVRAAGPAGQVSAAKAWLLKPHDRPW